MKIAKYILSLACALAVAMTAGAAKPGETPMKVMSYNVRSSSMKADTGEKAWAARRQPSAAMLRDEKPDLIGLQEAHADQRDAMVEDLGDIYTLYSAVDDGVDDARTGHTALMYRKDRFKELDHGYFWLSPTPDVESKPEWGALDRHYRTTVWVLLRDKKTGKKICFFNTHLPYKKDDTAARDACMELIVNRMKAKAGDDMVVFLTGDMNASWHENDKRRDCLKPCFAWMKGARETTPVNLNPDTRSFNAFGRKASEETWNLDHIFYRNITPLEFNVVSSDKYGLKYVSDHYPITLTLKY